MKILQKIVWFVVYSSQNPEKLSLTLKGLAGTIGSIIFFSTLYLGAGNIDQQEIQNSVKEVVDAIGTIIIAFGTLVTAFGALRKVYLTIVGKNKAL